VVELHREGKALRYGGALEEDQLKRWLVQQLSAVVLLQDEEELDRFLASNREALVVFVADIPDVQTWALEDVVSDAAVALCTDSKVAAVPSVRLFFGHEPHFASADIDLTNDPRATVRDLISKNRLPFPVSCSDENAQKLLEAGDPLVVFFVEDQGRYSQAVADVREGVVTANTGMPLVLADLAKPPSVRLAAYARLGRVELPTVCVLLPGKDARVAPSLSRMDGPINPGAVASFLRDWRPESAAPMFKSQPPPTQVRSAVRRLVGSDFRQQISGLEHTFVMVDAPWCGHCRKLEPDFAKLAKKCSAHGNIALVSIDGSNNDLVDADSNPVEISGFPSLLLFKNGVRKPIEYRHDRSTESMYSWLLQELSMEV